MTSLGECQGHGVLSDTPMEFLKFRTDLSRFGFLGIHPFAHEHVILPPESITTGYIYIYIYFPITGEGTRLVVESPNVPSFPFPGFLALRTRFLGPSRASGVFVFSPRRYAKYADPSCPAFSPHELDAVEARLRPREIGCSVFVVHTCGSEWTPVGDPGKPKRTPTTWRGPFFGWAFNKDIQ